MSIAASELILNDDGSIYHLHLHPEDVAPIVLTVGDPDRVARVSRFFDRIEIKRQKREFVTHTGELNGRRLTVISSGIGTDNIDILVNELDAVVNIDLKTRQPKAQQTALDIIRVGTSGSLQADIPVGSFVASSHGVGMDNLLHFYEWTPTAEEAAITEALRAYLPELPVKPYTVASSAALLDKFPDWYQGMTVTCAGFYAPQGRMLRAGRRVPDLPVRLAGFRHEQHRCTNLEMETAGLFGLARLLGHRALSCNVILANRAVMEFSQNPARDEEALIRTVLERLTMNA